MKLILYGAGNWGEELCKNIECSEHEILMIVDSNSAKWGTKIQGHVVFSPENISFLDYDRLCITVADTVIRQQIRGVLLSKYGFDTSREIAYEDLNEILCEENGRTKKAIQNHVVSNREKSIIFDCYNVGLGLGGIEEWTKDLCAEFLKIKPECVNVISKPGKYKLSADLETHVIFPDYWSEPLSAYAVEELVNIILEKLPCKIVTSQPGNVLKAAQIIKNNFPDDIEVISVIHGGKEEIYDAYVKNQSTIDIYVGVSNDIREAMIDRGVEKESVYVMSCPFECPKDIERSYTVKSGDPICIGYAGRLVKEQKRMDLLMKMILTLSAMEINFKAEIAGDGPMREEMYKCIKNNGLQRKVKFLGKIDRNEIAGFWRRQDICVNIADYEGRSISIIEAMGNGAVPVVTMVSGTREDIEDGVNGFLVPLGDYKTMAKRIEYLANKRQLLPEMGKKSHEIIYPKSLMSEHIKLWKKILFGKMQGGNIEVSHEN